MSSTRHKHLPMGGCGAPDDRGAFLRSPTDLVDGLIAFVVERHPYEVPNITALPRMAGNPRYLSWIRRETRPDRHPDPRS
jgi:periplasmic divalent cation tolerance protein